MLTKRGGEKSPHHLNNIEAKTDITETHFGTTYSSTIKDNSVSYTTGNNTVEYSYTEDENQVNADSVKYNSETSISNTYQYDDNGNITTKTISYNFVNTNSVCYSFDVVNRFDDKNRITAYGYNKANNYYKYDNNGQIERCDNKFAEGSFIYTYDNRGNILTKNKYGFTKNENITSSPIETTMFTYSNDGWNDKLVSVNGTPLTYDANGNVLTYGDKSYTWSSGRNLAQLTDGDNIYSYTYDENGIRTSKTVNGVTTYYNTKDGVILSQTDGINTMYFQYDVSGAPIGMIWNGTQYFYMTNQMGDVISITDAQGYEYVQYDYDDWGGTCITTTTNNTEFQRELANINPLRYRGYYLDTETGYYYLQSRYYDPSICRFINADLPEYAKVQKNEQAGINLFVYCCNDPVNNSDPSGFKTKFSEKDLKKESWLFRIASYFGIDYSRALKKTQYHYFINLNLRVLILKVYVSVGLTNNYRAGISFSLTRNGLGVTRSTGLGNGYSIAFAYTLNLKGLTRSIALTYTSKSGLYVSCNVEFYCSHLVTVAVVAACCTQPQFIPAVRLMYSKNSSKSIPAVINIANVLRRLCHV